LNIKTLFKRRCFLLTVRDIYWTEKPKTSLYDKLPKEMLAGFYHQIQNNIEKGILSNGMYHELRLIERTAKRRGISIEYLNEKGALIIAEELNKNIIEV
jgi:hypothetical protein